MRSAARSAVVCVGLLACGPAPAAPPVEPAPLAPGWTEARAELTGAAGSSFTVALEPPAQGCVAVVALAAPTMDVDVRLYAADGALLAEDRSPSPNAAALACAPEPSDRLYAQIEVARGAGPIEQRILRGAGDRSVLAELVGHEPSGPMEPALREQARAIAEAERALDRAGLALVRAPERIVVDTQVGFDVSTEAGRCYAVRAICDGPLRIDLTDEVGHAIGQGEGLVLACAERTGRWRARLRSDARRVAHVLVGAGELVRWPSSPAPLLAAAEDEGLAALGYGQGTRVATLELRAGEARAFAVAGDGCRLVSAGGDMLVGRRGQGVLARGYAHVCGPAEVVLRALRGGPQSLVVHPLPRSDEPAWLDAWLEGALDGFEEGEGSCLRVDASAAGGARVSLFDDADRRVALGTGTVASAWSCQARRAEVEPSSARQLVRRR